MKNSLIRGLSFAACIAVASFATAQSAPTPKVKIALAGDSTMTDKAGWGVGFAALLTDDVELSNLSRGGRSSRTFIQEGRWKALLESKPDYVLIQFGHNDQPGKPERSTDLATEFPVFMKQYVTDARAAGIVPILITPLVRREFKTDPHHIESSLSPWADAVRKIAADEHVPLIELHDRSKAVCEALGADACVALLSNAKPDGAGFDGTHLTPAGSLLIGAIVADELKRVVPELATHVRAIPKSSEAAPATKATGGGGDRSSTKPVL